VEVASDVFQEDKLLEAKVREKLPVLASSTSENVSGGLASLNKFIEQKEKCLSVVIEELLVNTLGEEEARKLQREQAESGAATKRVDLTLDRCQGETICDGSMYCNECKLWFPGIETPNRKHCWSCNKCVTGFDHHCRYLNQCIGESNYRVWSVFVAALTLLSASQIALTAYSIFKYTEEGSVCSVNAKEIWGGILYLILASSSLFFEFLVFIAVFDLVRLHLLLAYRQCRLDATMATLAYRVLEMPDGNEKRRDMLLLAEKGGGSYVSTYTRNNFQYDNKILLLKLAKHVNTLMLMTAEYANDKLKFCLEALYQNSRAMRREHLAAESEVDTTLILNVLP